MDRNSGIFLYSKRSENIQPQAGDIDFLTLPLIELSNEIRSVNGSYDEYFRDIRRF